MKLKKCFMTFLILTSSTLSVQAASEPIIDLRVTDYGWLTSFPALQSILDTYIQDQENKLNDIQPIKDPQRLVKGIGNSTAVSSRGVGTDYSTDMENFYFGLSAAAAADFEKNVALKDLESGLGGAAGFVFGKKMNERLNLYASIGGLSHSETFQGVLNTDLDAEISTFNVGFHARYDLMPGSGDKWFGWGGLKTHFGYEYNYNELTFENKLNEDLQVDLGGVATIEGRLKGTPKYVITTKTHSFPLEFSTDLRFLNIFSLFGGVGGDLNFGKSKGKGDVKADLFSPLTCASGICTNLNLPQVQGQANLNAEQNVNLFTGRAFGGLQMNFPHFSIYGMANKTLGTQILGVSLGAKLVF
jgi:hypothetical protein